VGSRVSNRDCSEGYGSRSLLEQKTLTRARFLRLLGAGVGLSVIPGSSLAGLGGAASAQTTGSPTILGGGVYPIGLWWPPPPAQTTTQRYQEIVAAGFNFVIGGNGVTNDTYNSTALNAARTNNLRYVLWDSKLTRVIRESATYTDPQARVRTRINELLQRYGGNTALAGLGLYDEPSTDLFGILGYAREYLQTKNSKQLPWSNLYPYTNNPETLASLGASSYDDYLQRYRSDVKLPFISFDYYPLVSETAITASYFQNWAAVRKYSLQTPRVPSWCFIQSVDFRPTANSYPPRRRPNEAELFWQVNVSLAYGAKGIQYFTYWTPNGNATTQFGEALVSLDGRLTPLYEYTKRANAYLKVIGKVLLPLTSESVVHAGESTLPPGTTAFSADAYVQSSSGSPAIIAKFYKSAGETERHLLVVNRSYSNMASTRLTLRSTVREVYLFNSGTGTFARITPQSGNVLSVSIAPGKAQLYLLRRTTT
jgi:hypothetical protein